MICEALMKSIRLALLTAATATGAAILLARANPERPDRRAEAAAPYRILDEIHSTRGAGVPRLLDVETGRLEDLPLPPGLSLDLASLSPWGDRGHRQVVGVGQERSGAGQWQTPSRMEMVRMNLPGGEVFDRIDLSDRAVPNGAPCWSPGALARVLYVGQDGRIYRLDFEGPGPDGGVAGSREIRPKALTWRAPAPAEGEATVLDLSWPDDARLGGRLLASLRFRGGGSGGRPDWQIWWLELDRGGTSIIAAGPLLVPVTSDEVGARRMPELVREVGEAPALAYLAKVPQHGGYQLRVVPIRFDAGPGAPLAREAEARVLARGCSLAAPSATADGRWINVVRPHGRSVRVERMALAGMRRCSRGCRSHEFDGGWHEDEPDPLPL